MRARFPHITLFVLVAGVAACAGAEPVSVDPFGIADDSQGSRIDELEAVEPRPARARASERQKPTAEVLLPAPPTEMARTIDAQPDDWRIERARRFEGRQAVESGEQFWSGRADASFRVAVGQDAGHVYFWIDVRDDEVIEAGSHEVMSDGVILWLRDPLLEEMVEALPSSVRRRVGVRPELAVIFTPDGQYWRWDDQQAQLNRGGLEAQARQTEDGYQVEIALKAGVLEYAAAFPMEQLAFRVDVLDGDDPEKRGGQTQLSMLPKRAEGGARYALLDLEEGLLPHEKALGKPPRPDALGRWRLEEGSWSYRSFEVVPSNWMVYPDRDFVAEIVDETGAIASVCAPAKTDSRVVEAYRSARGQHLAALVYCGTRAPRGRCPDTGASEVLWVHFNRRGGASWEHYRTRSVLPGSLPQCYDVSRGARAGGPSPPLYSGFSMVPMEMVGSSVWAVGWQRASADRSHRHVEQGVWFADVRDTRAYAGEVKTSVVKADRDARMLSTRKVFLTPIDDEKGVDICSVERLEDQVCDGLDRGCQTPERRTQRKVQIWTWAEDEGAFEKFFLTKHRNCKTSFDFSARKAVMLLQREGRLGLVASPALRRD